MQSPKTFAIIGGDLRIITLANLLYDNGYNVNVFGISRQPMLKAPQSAELAQAIYDADCIILPLPLLNSDGNINAPYYPQPINLLSVLKTIDKSQILFAGNLSQETEKLLKTSDINYIDYFKQEDLTITNAMITAEGAVEILLKNYHKVICGSRILILGHGRIGKFLTKILYGFGAELTVAGRRPETEAWVRSSGIDYTSISAEESYSDKYDIIINTVPELILTKTRLDMLSKDCLIIDLASTPGGTDFAHASALGIQAIHALSLPGKTAPISAGKALYDTIINILVKLEV